MATVETGARLHFGFQNLSLAHPRLYGGIGLGLREPRLVVDIEQATTVECPDPAVEPYLRTVVEELGVPGARAVVRERFARHAGLGSGTQQALACLVGVARAYGRTVSPREWAPRLGRAGRSGVGVATFDAGGFVVDTGHPTARFESDPPQPTDWDTPPVLGRWTPPEDLRFVLVTPETAARGPSGGTEDSRMWSVVERADPETADEIATLLTRRLLPALAEGDISAFGRALSRLGRLNGAWYADEQGGVYRPPADRIVDILEACDGITGAGQSSWGPTVYGVTDASDADNAATDTRRAVDDLGLDGTVRVVRPSDSGATVRD